MRSVIVGTAGHIDHGKSTLVEALTGTHPDRLEEEKRRGITIDLGFAFLEEGGVRFGFVDVPGHERFVKNMVAGAWGVDVLLLVIAADEVIKPQTREHFDICRLLGVKRGVIALTKIDRVDAESLALERLEIEEFIQGSFLAEARIVPVSAKTGEGLHKLKEASGTGSAGSRGKRSATLFSFANRPGIFSEGIWDRGHRNARSRANLQRTRSGITACRAKVARARVADWREIRGARGGGATNRGEPGGGGSRGNSTWNDPGGAAAISTVAKD